MKTKEFMFEGKKPRIRMPKQRDPNWQTMRAKATSGAGGEHKDRKRAEKQGNVKHRKDLIPMESIVNEDLSNFTDAGIPAEFAKNILRKFQINHDAEISSVPGKPKTSDIENGDMIINVLPGDNVVAVLKRREYPRFSASYTVYHRLTLIDGKFQSDTDTSVAAATKGMTARGKFYRISNEYLRYADSPRRGDKPTDDEVRDRSTNDPLAGSSYDIYSYMNDTFMPRMRAQMETMVDDIYANLRKLDKNKDQWGGERSIQSKNQQEVALQAASIIEQIAKDGFTRNTMERFLSTFDKRHHGFASIPNNERELKNLLKTEPNARAKWAKVVLDAAKQEHRRVKEMVAAPVMKALRGEDIENVQEDGGVAASPRLQRAHERERSKRGLPHPDEYLRMIEKKQKEIDAMRAQDLGKNIKEAQDPDEGYMDRVISDLHKDARGFRPDQEWGNWWMSLTYKEKVKVFDDMVGELGESVKEASDFGEPKEILADVLDTLEREVEWPLTEVMDYEEVLRLLAPIKNAVNQRLKTMDKGVREGSDNTEQIKAKIQELEAEQKENEYGSFAYDSVDAELQFLYGKLDKIKNQGVREGSGDTHLKRLEYDVRQLLDMGEYDAAKENAALAPTADLRTHLRKIIRKAMTSPKSNERSTLKKNTTPSGLSVKQHAAQQMEDEYGDGNITFHRDPAGGYNVRHIDDAGEIHSHQYDPRTGKVDIRNIVRSTEERMAETTRDKPFDQMMTMIKKGTRKQATADRRERDAASRERARAAFGPSPADKLTIRPDKGVAEGKYYGYDDSGYSLRPGHDEGEPVYDPRYDLRRSGGVRSSSSFASQPRGMYFYNVPADKEQQARSIGLRQTKSGKWYSRTSSDQADKEFGKGRYWEPKQ